MFELDHIFICCSKGAPEAQALIDFGLAEGAPNTHPGQGTANRRFFFENAMLELLWVEDSEAAQSPVPGKTRLWDRWTKRAERSPFGICMRPLDTGRAVCPFPSWDYKPGYLPENLSIKVGENSENINEPMTFFLPFWGAESYAEHKTDFEHPAGVKRVTRVEIANPGNERPSSVSRSLEQCGEVFFVSGNSALATIAFDEGKSGKRHSFEPELPLTFVY